MLISTKDMLIDARKRNYGIPAFAATDMQSIKAIIYICNKEKSPCLMQVGERTLDMYGADNIVALVNIAAKNSKVPVALHLDHGSSYKSIANCIQAGFSSVMIDASKMNFSDNIKKTKKIVELAHACNITVEAELGHIGQGLDGDDDNKQSYTQPDQAVDFVNQTNIDSLAIAVGTAHGLYKKEPKIDFDLLKKISDKVSIPLVLHGASGTPDLDKTVKYGISKVNIFTDTDKVLIKKVKEIMNTNTVEKLRGADIWEEANQAMIPMMQDFIRLLNANNKA